MYTNIYYSLIRNPPELVGFLFSIGALINKSVEKNKFFFAEGLPFSYFAINSVKARKMNDTQIIELIRNQEHSKVFSVLYKYYPVVKKMILSSGGSLEDAEDIYQEALIVFYKKASAPDFKLTASINTYLYSICRFMRNDQLKKQKKITLVSIENTTVDETAFVEILETEGQFKQAEKIISELGKRCKELLMLFYFDRKTMKEIAQKMQYSSENTAKNQKYKCLETAKQKLKTLHQTN